MSYLTADELAALQSTTLDRGAPFIIAGVSTSQLSVARHYGGCRFQGLQYFYMRDHDELIRADVLKWLGAFRRRAERLEKAAVSAPVQEGLL